MPSSTIGGTTPAVTGSFETRESQESTQTALTERLTFKKKAIESELFIANEQNLNAQANRNPIRRKSVIHLETKLHYIREVLDRFQR
ncbi:MAG: hypothetical protein COT84_03255 [Chlamydiae bacterium CG10_big_fil_rev_8_21_14_0_10_35_9]|nr:MAG: hypothetical protein COT84_03255 [Chlamydiae bacterium CG10_big_fil_rev_8_21_14_0_10_35_9]